MAKTVVRSKTVVLLLLMCCLLLLPLWESVIVLSFVVRYFMSILVLQSYWWGRESWLLCLVCITSVLWLLCSSSSRCHRFICSLWLWYMYFLIILTYFFYYLFKKKYQYSVSHLGNLSRIERSYSITCSLILLRKRQYEVSLVTKQNQICNKWGTISTHGNTNNMSI